MSYVTSIITRSSVGVEAAWVGVFSVPRIFLSFSLLYSVVFLVVDECYYVCDYRIDRAGLQYSFVDGRQTFQD